MEEEINYNDMRYILDETGYIYEVNWGCETGECTAYTGTIPEGYESLEGWYNNANIRAYKIVDGNLVYDAQRDAELEAQYEVEAERNANASVGYVNDKLNQMASLYDSNLKKTTTDLVIEDASEYSIPEIVIESKELFDKDNITKGAYPTQDGGTGNYFTWNTTDYMEVIHNEKYCYKGLTNTGNAPYSHYYDENKNFISSFKQATGENIITIPSNAYYVKFPVEKNDGGNRNDLDTFSFKRISYEDGIKLQVSNANLLVSDCVEETINGLTFVPNEDGTVYVKGTATEDVEYIVGGSMENTKPLFMFDTVHSIDESIPDFPFWINPIVCVVDGAIEQIEGTYVRGKLYNYDGTDRELVADQIQTEVSENKYITCATLFFSSGTTIDATLGLTVRKQDCTGDYLQGKTRGIIDINISELKVNEKIVISGGYVKLVDVEGNEETIKSILPLMSYEKGENYDYTLIQCSEDVDITTTYYSNIKVGGFNITTNGLEIEIKSNYDYTEEDLEKLNNYLVDLGTLTEEEMIKYDVSGDGKIMSNDALLMNYMLTYGVTTERGIKFKINNGEMANMFNFLSITDGNDNVLTKLGLRGLETNGLTVKGIDILNRFGNLGNNIKTELGVNDAGNLYLRATVNDDLQYQLNCNPDGRLVFQKCENGVWSNIGGAGYRVNDVIITYTDTNPSVNYGGTWSLVDVEMPPATVSNPYTLNTTNTTSATVNATKLGHFIFVQYQFVPKVALTDTQTEILTFDMSKLGVSEFCNIINHVAFTDGGNCSAFMNVAKNGVMACLDVIPDNSISAGQTVYGSFIAPIAINKITNKGKRYWRRTA